MIGDVLITPHPPPGDQRGHQRPLRGARPTVARGGAGEGGGGGGDQVQGVLAQVGGKLRLPGTPSLTWVIGRSVVFVGPSGGGPARQSLDTADATAAGNGATTGRGRGGGRGEEGQSGPDLLLLRPLRCVLVVFLTAEIRVPLRTATAIGRRRRRRSRGRRRRTKRSEGSTGRTKQQTRLRCFNATEFYHATHRLHRPRPPPPDWLWRWNVGLLRQT